VGRKISNLPTKKDFKKEYGGEYIEWECEHLIKPYLHYLNAPFIKPSGIKVTTNRYNMILVYLVGNDMPDYLMKEYCEMWKGTATAAKQMILKFFEALCKPENMERFFKQEQDGYGTWLKTEEHETFHLSDFVK
jgi:hypothetical protein